MKAGARQPNKEQVMIVTPAMDSKNGTLLSPVTEGMEFTLRGATFRVTQVIATNNTVYLEPKLSNGKWAGFDRGGNLLALQAALAAGPQPCAPGDEVSALDVILNT